MQVAESVGAEGLNYQHQWSVTRRMVAEHSGEYPGLHDVTYEALGGTDLPTVDPDALAATVARIRRHASRSDCRTYVNFYPDLSETELRQWYSDPHNWVQRRTPACAWMNAYILPNGDLEACPGLVPGNVVTDSFAEVWNNPTFRSHRQRLARAEAFPICARCCFFCRTV